MRWYKHMVDAANDLFIQDIEAEFGDTGYAFWFKTLELLGSQGDNGTMDISENVWRRVIHSHRTDHLRRLYTFATGRGKLSVEKLSNGMLRVKCRKFAEYADNYTKYNGRSSKRLQRLDKLSSPRIEVDVDIEEEKKALPFDTAKEFEALWLQYPRREGKKEAVRHFAASVKTAEDLAKIQTALRNYKAKLLREKTEMKFTKHGSTWFNNWQEWVEMPDEKPRPVSPLLQFGGTRQ